MGPKHADRLPGLNEKSLVVLKLFERGNDPVEILPGARGSADAAIDHQLVGVFRNVGIEVVH